MIAGVSGASELAEADYRVVNAEGTVFRGSALTPPTSPQTHRAEAHKVRARDRTSSPVNVHAADYAHHVDNEIRNDQQRGTCSGVPNDEHCDRSSVAGIAGAARWER